MTTIDEVGRDVGLALIDRGWPIDVFVRKDIGKPTGVAIELGEWRLAIVVRNPDEPGLTADLIGMFTEALTESQAQRNGQRQR